MPARKHKTPLSSESSEDAVGPATKGEQTRTDIINAAYALFVKKGFHGTSVRQIADRADLALGGIYNYFENKEEIFAAVLDAYHPYRVILPALESVEGETIEDFVGGAAEQVRQQMEGAGSRLLPLIFIEAVEFQGRHLGQLAQKLSPTLLGFFQRFAGKRGKLRPIPFPVMVRTFFGLFIAHMITEMVAKNVPLLRDGNYDWFGGMVDIYLHGILQPES